MVVPPTAPMTGKSELRRRMRAARSAFVAGLSKEAREILELDLAARLVPLLQGSQAVASYRATGSEIDAPIHAPHFAVVYPRVAGERLTFHDGNPARFAAGYAGIPEPRDGSPLVVPAIVLVPLVAVDLSGNRIGQGAGHYDRTLAALRAAGPVTAIGLAWEMQIVSAISADPWDQPLDWIATPQRLVDCRAHR